MIAGIGKVLIRHDISVTESSLADESWEYVSVTVAPAARRLIRKNRHIFGGWEKKRSQNSNSSDRLQNDLFLFIYFLLFFLILSAVLCSEPFQAQMKLLSCPPPKKNNKFNLVKRKSE